MQPSANILEDYLPNSETYDYINLMLFSHGVESTGPAPISRWRSILELARKEGSFVAVDEKAFPRDFAVFVRYQDELKKIKGRSSMPEPMPIA